MNESEHISCRIQKVADTHSDTDTFLKEQFNDEDGEEDTDGVRDKANGDEIACFLDTYGPQVYGEDKKRGFGASHDDCRETAGEGIRSGCFDDVRE